MNDRCDNCGGRWDRPGLYRCDEADHAAPSLAQRIVADIERELNGRKGLGWRGVGRDVAEALRDGLAAIVESHLKKGDATCG